MEDKQREDALYIAYAGVGRERAKLPFALWSRIVACRFERRDSSPSAQNDGATEVLTMARDARISPLTLPEQLARRDLSRLRRYGEQLAFYQGPRAARRPWKGPPALCGRPLR
jgi:hypothetical protein